MTRAWKLRVREALEENKKNGKKPSNIQELAISLPGGKKDHKAGLGRALDPDGLQVTFNQVDAICELLEIPPPLVEADDDEDLQADLDLVRSLTTEARRELMLIAKHMPRRND